VPPGERGMCWWTSWRQWRSRRLGDLVAMENLQTLLDFKYNHRFKAEDGSRGGRRIVLGQQGAIALKFPVAPLFDAETGEPGDLVAGADSVCRRRRCKGLGNKHFLSNRNRAPEYSPGLPGEQLLRLELKLLAEVGIIGLPNAGKSTLMRYRQHDRK